MTESITRILNKKNFSMNIIPKKVVMVEKLWVLVYNGGGSLCRVQFCSVNGIFEKELVDLVYQNVPKQMVLN